MNKQLRVSFEETEDIGIVTHYKGKPFTGIAYRLFENGHLKYESEMLNGLKQGIHKEFSLEGKLLFEARCKDDLLNGIFKMFNEKGIVIFEGNCINDKKEGVWKKYNNNNTTGNTQSSSAQED